MKNTIVLLCEIPELNTTHIHIAAYSDHICIHYGTISFNENAGHPIVVFKTTLNNERLSRVPDLCNGSVWDIDKVKQVVAFLQAYNHQRPQRTLANLAKNIELLANEKELPTPQKDELLQIWKQFGSLKKVRSL